MLSFIGLDYSGCSYVKKHCLDDVLSAVRHLHDEHDPPPPHVNVQHAALRPTLRSYQKRAVAWMLYKERYHTDGGAECDAGGAGNCQRQTSGMHSASIIHFYIKATNSRMMNV